MSFSTPRRLGLLAVPLVLSAALAGCGSSGGSGGSGSDGSGGDSARPSTSQLQAALKAESPKLPDSIVKCLATNMESSSLSDTALEAIIKDNQNYKPDTSDSAAINSVKDKLVDCLAPLLSSGAASAFPSGSALPLP